MPRLPRLLARSTALWAALLSLGAAGPSAGSPLDHPRANQTIVQAQGAANSSVTVYINGTVVPRSGGDSIPWTDISGLVRPGQNQVRVVYPRDPFNIPASVTISRAEQPGQFRRLTQLSVRQTGPQGQTYTLVLPAQGDPGRAPSAGSAQAQTVVRLDGANVLFGGPKLKLTLNGRDLGDLGGDNLDISNLVRPGPNTLRARWTSKGGPAGFSLKVAYAGPKNQFKDVATLQIGLNDPAQGERDLPFDLP